MKTYPIPAPLLQEIANYLQRQPWLEVNNFLAAIQKIVIEIDQPHLAKVNGKEDNLPVQ
jgi:hypothetical protein